MDAISSLPPSPPARIEYLQRINEEILARVATKKTASAAGS